MSEQAEKRRFWRKRRVRGDGRPGSEGPRRRARGWFARRTRNERIGIYTGGGLFLLILLAVGFVFSPLPSVFVTPRIATAIEEALGPGYKVAIGSSRVDVTANGLDLRLDDFVVRESGGGHVIAVPRAAIALDGNLLLSQKVTLRRLRLSQPHLTLRIEENGQVSLAGAEGGAALFSLPVADVPQAAPAEIFGFLAAADALLREGGAFANFELAEVTDASIAIEDRRRGRVDRIERVDARVRRGADTLTASASSATPRENWSVTATMAGRPDALRNFDIGFQNLPLGRIMWEALRGTSPADFGGRLFGHFYARLAPDGSVPAAEARLDLVGFSVVERDKPEARMDIERTRISAAWNGEDRRLRISPIEVSTQASRFMIGGYAAPVDDEADEWTFALTGTEQTVPGSHPSMHVLKFEKIEASGTVQRTARRLVLDNASVQGRALSVAGYGAFDFSGERPMADFALAGSRSPIAAVLRIWPGLIAPNARKWIEAHVPRGMVEEATIAMQGPIGGKFLPRRVAIDARFSDAMVGYLPDAPPAVGVHGYVRIADEHMETVVEGGRIEVADGEPLSVGGTTFSTLDHRPDPFQGELATRLEGPVASIGALMSVPKLASMAPGVAPLMRGDGTLSVNVNLSGEYGKDADLGRLVPRIEASLSGWSMKQAIGGRDIDKGNFHLTVDPASANLRGELNLSGAPLAVEAAVGRTPENRFGETVVRFSIDPSKMKDFDNEALRIAGPVSVELVQSAPGVMDNARVRAELSGASVQGPVGLAKAGGSAGQVNFTVQPNGDKWRLQDLVAQGSGIDIRGWVDIAKSGGLAAAQFSHFAMRQGDDARLDVSRSGQAYKVVARGSTINLQPILKDVMSGAPEKRGIDIDIDAKFGTVLGHNGETMSGVDLQMSRRNNTTVNVSLNGHLGAGPVEARTTGQEPRVISLRAADSGAVLRFVDLYRRMRGGQLRLDVSPAETSRGRLVIQNFQVVGDQRLASVASNNRQGQRTGNGTMTFTQMEAEFRIGGGRILIDDFEVFGSELGATLTGEINYAHDSVAISGTFVPAYAVNNLFGKLPLFGQILGGGSDGGLVGVTFAVDGPWASPQMRVNPLSAVAPGFLRKIFEFRSQNPGAAGAAPQQPTNITGGRPKAPAQR